MKNLPSSLWRRLLVPKSFALLSCSSVVVAVGCGTPEAAPLVGPFSVVYEQSGGMPRPPAADGTVCDEVVRWTVTQDSATQVGFCAPEDANRVYLSRSTNPNAADLAPLRAALGRLGFEGDFVFAAGESTVVDDTSFALEVKSSAHNFKTSSARHNPNLPDAVVRTLEAVEALPVGE